MEMVDSTVLIAVDEVMQLLRAGQKWDSPQVQFLLKQYESSEASELCHLAWKLRGGVRILTPMENDLFTLASAVCSYGRDDPLVVELENEFCRDFPRYTEMARVVRYYLAWDMKR